MLFGRGEGEGAGAGEFGIWYQVNGMVPYFAGRELIESIFREYVLEVTVCLWDEVGEAPLACVRLCLLCELLGWGGCYLDILSRCKRENPLARVQEWSRLQRKEGENSMFCNGFGSRLVAARQWCVWRSQSLGTKLGQYTLSDLNSLLANSLSYGSAK